MSNKKCVDLAADPLLPNGWSVQHHRGGAKASKIERNGDNLYLNGRKIKFRLTIEQREVGVITGERLLRKLRGKLVLNANVLDYLLRNPCLIPEAWKKDRYDNPQRLFFWGTIYRDLEETRYVRYLYWRSRWQWNYRPVDGECEWDISKPAVCL